LNLIGVASESSDTTGTSATVSAYAIHAALTGQEPLRPEYYVRPSSAKLRQLFFTLGADFPETGDDETERGVIGGVKVILWTQRDISLDQKQFSDDAEALLIDAGKGLQQVVNDGEVLPAIDAAVCEATSASGGEIEGIDERKIPRAVNARIDELFRTKGKESLLYEEKAAALADTINKRPQVAVEFLTNQRQHDGTDEYSAVLTADVTRDLNLGFADRVALTLNASYEGLDRSSNGDHGDDSHGGKLAAQLRFYNAPTEIDRRVPWLASLATDARWLTKDEPRYRVQAKFVLALYDGLDLPLSVTWATSSDLNQEDEVVGNVGFTFDTAKLLPRLGLGG
jgi:hypothetical protein